MKKISLFWWIFWLLYSFEVADPELVEARWWTNKSVDKSTSCYGSACTTYRNEHKDNYYRNNYVPSGPAWGPTYNIHGGEVISGLFCVLTLGAACPAQIPAQQVNVTVNNQIPPPTIIERERIVEQVVEKETEFYGQIGNGPVRCTDQQLKDNKAPMGTNGWLQDLKTLKRCYYDLS